MEHQGTPRDAEPANPAQPDKPDHPWIKDEPMDQPGDPEFRATRNEPRGGDERPAASQFAGFMNRPEPGVIRVFDVDKPAHFREFPSEDMVALRPTDDEAIAVVTVKDSASPAERDLDDTDFAALFTNDGRPTEDFFRRSSYPACYTWAPPGEIAIC